jgi:hypothetical protein
MIDLLPFVKRAIRTAEFVTTSAVNPPAVSSKAKRYTRLDRIEDGGDQPSVTVVVMELSHAYEKLAGIQEPYGTYVEMHLKFDGVS